MNDEPELEPKDEEGPSKFIKAITEPLSKYGLPSWLVYAIAAFGGVYLLNPTFGILEFLPDNLPIVGNMDEGVAVMMILAGIVEALEGKKARRATETTEDVEKEK
jgi:uncharacterized membrane protein YkvA (DUF1232 family)